MHPLEKATYSVIVRESLLSQAGRVIVGCSAGPDSMALLHVLNTLSRRLDVAPAAVYVDHGLRPEETGREKELVEARAALLDVDFHYRRVNVAGEAEKRKISIEHAARDLRYGVLEKLALEYGEARIAVAHTADDQAEELLLRLIRGTGRAGLSGMKMIRDNLIIRPFLTRTKEELLAYLRRYDIPWLEDSSNLETRFLRNRLRLEVIPDLAKINPNITETLRRTTEVLQDEELVLVRLTDEAWQELVNCSSEGGEVGLSVRLPGLLALDLAIRRRLLEKVFIRMDSRPQREKIEQILHLAAEGEGGARLHFSRGLRLRKEGKRLLFSYPAGRIGARGDLGE